MSKKILIASDDSLLLDRTGGKLMTEDYEVLVARDGLDAIAGIVEHRPDMIIVDTAIPRVGGYGICALIKDNIEFGATPVVVVSDRGGLFDRARSDTLGAIRHLVKPIDDDELVEMANRYTDA
ncbi:MAG: response regulator [Gammaproteobacteria bacterium]|nr:response regulator [Gammaproteobacteria bacterium]MYD77176.1 response regulator [Gammaproteobacteria bacterium]